MAVGHADHGDEAGAIPMKREKKTGRSPSRAVRLSDIAAETGYSVTTVSKALNEKTDISAKTRHTILEALEKHGYQRRSRVSKIHRNIEVVFQNFDSMWSLEVLRGVMAQARPELVSVTLTESGDRLHPDSSWLEGILDRHPLGAVLIFSDVDADEKKALDQAGIPFVVYDPSGNPSHDGMSVQADNWTGGVVATRHLLDLGHRRIGMITGPNEMMCSHARLDGYSSALSERGIQPDRKLVREGDFTTRGGYEQAMALLRDPATRPTAIFAGSDLQAMGVYEAARQLRLRIPEDLSVVGFDDVETAAYMGPALTTVKQPLAEMAGLAVQMILQTTKGRPVRRQVVMPTTLKVRNSTRAPRGEERKGA